MSEEEYRAAREARADLANRAGGSTSAAQAVTRMVNAAVYQYERGKRREPQGPLPQPARGQARLPRAYRPAMAAAGERHARLRLAATVTRSGVLRYAEVGVGPPVLVVHGIFGGSDAGLRQLAPLVPDGSRMVAPSRFGYLGSALPPGAGPAHQADAFAELLDHLELDRVAVLAASAGATSALRLAIRHPDRVTSLVLVSPNCPGIGWGSGPVLRAFARWAWGSNRLMWMVRCQFPGILRGFMGVPVDLPLTASDRAVVDGELDGIFPVDERVAGALFDAFVSNPDIDTGYAFERISAPTLIVHARDDTLIAHSHAVALAEAIPGARLRTAAGGGHLLLGDQAEQIAAIRTALRGAQP